MSAKHKTWKRNLVLRTKYTNVYLNTHVKVEDLNMEIMRLCTALYLPTIPQV
jgi:hypothetical protein